MILVEYLNNEKYGKIAHFINNENVDIFSKVVEEDDMIIYEELSEEIQQELRNKDITDGN